MVSSVSMDGVYFPHEFHADSGQHFSYHCSDIEMVTASSQSGYNRYIAYRDSQIHAFLQLCLPCGSLIPCVSCKEENVAFGMDRLCGTDCGLLWSP